MICEDSMKLETILAIMECPWSLVNGNYAPLYKGYVLKFFNSTWLGQPGHISEMEMDRVSKAFVKVYDGFKGGVLFYTVWSLIHRQLEESNTIKATVFKIFLVDRGSEDNKAL
jgi:hypothetical protein